jgi:hypothetical protein
MLNINFFKEIDQFIMEWVTWKIYSILFNNILNLILDYILFRFKIDLRLIYIIMQSVFNRNKHYRTIKLSKINTKFKI